MNVAFIGCGGFGAGMHIPNVANNPNFNIIAFCDLNHEHLEALEAQYNPVYVTPDAERVFADPDVELVICVTKPSVRMPLMRMAVKYNKHLFVEKPLCWDEAEVPEMVELMRHSNGLFMVGFNRPYSPIMRTLKPYYKKHCKGNTTINYRIVGEAQLWPKSHYDAVINRRESTIIHEATHIFDLLNWLTDAMPTRVYTAGGGNVDNIIVLDYPDDVTAVITSGDNSTGGYPKERICIDSNFGNIVGDHFIELTVTGFGGVRKRHTFPYRVGDKEYNTNAREADEHLWNWRSSVTQEEIEHGYYYDRQLMPEKGHAYELEAFRQMIVEGRPSETDVVRGALANLIAWRAIDSWEQKQALELDFSDILATR